jgi:hypothetical protein
MSNLVPHLADLAKRINAAHAQAETALRAGLEHAKTAGELLLEAKRQCPHGQWLPWLEAKMRFSARTAQAYMRIAEHWPELEAKAQGLAHLTVEGALEYLAEPREVAVEADFAAAIKKTRIPPQYHQEALENVKRKQVYGQRVEKEIRDWWYDFSGQRNRDCERAQKEAAFRRFQSHIRNGDLGEFLLKIGRSAGEFSHDLQIATDGHPVRFYENVGHCEKLSAKLTTLQELLTALQDDLAHVLNQARAPKVIQPDGVPLLPGPE